MKVQTRNLEQPKTDMLFNEANLENELKQLYVGEQTAYCNKVMEICKLHVQSLLQQGQTSTIYIFQAMFQLNHIA